MTNESQPLDLERELKTVDQLQPGDVLVDFDDGTATDTYLTVRLVEPITAEPGRYLVVFAGGGYSNVRGTTEVAIATAEEIAAAAARVRDIEQRASLRAGLMRVVELLDNGLPVPAAIGIDMRLFATPDGVRAWAAALGTDADDKVTEHGHSVAIRRHPLASTEKRSLPDVEMDAWHLGDRPAVES